MTSNDKHHKHPPLARPALGEFARQEWALLGTPCGEIQTLAARLIERLSPRWKLAYVDADHAAGETPNDSPLARAHLRYTDKIAFHRLDWQGKADRFHLRPLFHQVDAALVNGNHFPAQRQIVVIDPRKDESLQRKRERLTDVELLLLTPDGRRLPPWLKEHLPHWHSLPLLDFHESDLIADFLEQRLQQGVPPLKGLVLAGGKSLRMGQDKGAIAYHGKPQREYLLELLAPFCREVFLSCRPDQMEELKDHPLLPDSFLGLGPFGALLSAFRQDPDSAWLVVACDLPLLDHPTLQHLTRHRNPSATATAYLNPETGFPDPLLTIWEPRAYPTLLQFLAQGYSCPRKVLINSPAHILQPPDPSVLSNANTPEDLERILGMKKE